MPEDVMTPEMFEQYQKLVQAAILSIYALEKARQTVPNHLFTEMDAAITRMAGPLHYIRTRRPLRKFYCPECLGDPHQNGICPEIFGGEGRS